MKILFDIWHLPQYNFFRRSIESLDVQQYDICATNRSKLAQIIKKEQPNSSLFVFGDYNKNRGIISLVYRVILPRMWSMYKLIRKNKYDFIISASYQSNIIAKLLGIPSIAFNDDPEKNNFKIVQYFANEVIIPPLFDKINKKVRVMNALKEWAYLSPLYFTPNNNVLKEYKLTKKKYIFIREVSTKSLNYKGQEENIIARAINQLPIGYKCVLSLENKGTRHLYPKDWIVLEEPVSDIHSLMYYSSFVISSGDSVAREGALLGVPGIYCGHREMRANKLLADQGLLFKIDILKFSEFYNSFNYNMWNQIEIRQKLNNDWDDVTSLILNKIKENTK